MCCFSAEVAHVGDTRIFARGLEDGSQYLVYSMTYAAGHDLAMILPLPTPVHPAEDAVKFIDLSNYPTFFDDLHAGIDWPLSRSMDKSLMLEVHEVGSFEASFVPNQDDFQRLDKRFRISRTLWQQLPLYDDYGFAVFKLKAGSKTVHPTAFRFPRRNPDELFFPTVHIHHNEVEPTADYDHELYFQSDKPVQNRQPLPDLFGDWLQTGRADSFMNIEGSLGIIDGESSVLMLRLVGEGTNQDVFIS